MARTRIARPATSTPPSLGRPPTRRPRDLARPGGGALREAAFSPGRTRGDVVARPDADPTTRPGAEARRAALLARLTAATAPVPGDLLARELGVSRQAIVHDVAVLRAAGRPIVATVRGYLLVPAPAPDLARAVVAVRHAPVEAEAELNALVDLGVRVADVVVEHPVYGELRAQLQIESRADVAAWAEATRRSGAHLLSELTDGVHLHTLEATSGGRLEAARAALRELGMLLPES